MTNLVHVLALVATTPWAIDPDYGTAVAEILYRRAYQGIRLTDQELEDICGSEKAAVEARRAKAGSITSQGNGVAVIPIYGVITPRGQMLNSSGQTSVEALTQVIREADNNPQVGTIILDFNSPGGNVQGVEEAAQVIRETKTRVIALANHTMASAAYWLASAADEIVATPTSTIGSIGVYTMHQDLSQLAEKEGVKTTYIHAGARKVDGNPFEPLSEEARQRMQRSVDNFYQMFTGAVARGRGVSIERVQGPQFGEGSAMSAQEALANGLVDRIGTLDDLVSDAVSNQAARASAMADLAARENYFKAQE